MKKLLAVLLACVMVFSFAVTAFAADSPESDDYEITSDVTVSDDTWLAAAKALGLKDADKLTVYFNGDIHLKNGKPFEGTKSVALTVNGVTANSTVYVLHQHHGDFRSVPITKGTNAVTATFDGFSPIAVLIDKATLSATTSGSSAKSATGTTSPKTGEAPYVAILAIVAALAAGGIVICRKNAAEQ